MSQKIYKLVLKESKIIVPNTIHLVFEKENKDIFSFTPGQFITLKIDKGDKILNRNYSVANSPGNNHIEIACAYVEGGLATNLLFNLKPGETVNAMGPLGLFVLKDEKPKRYVLIATGTGVTPYRAMLNELSKRVKEQQIEVVIILGVRSAQELLYSDDFINFAKNNPNCSFKAALSREEPSKEYDFAIKGHVQDLFPSLNLDPSKDIVYLCGNPNMVDDAYTKLEEQGFDKKSMRRERYAFVH